MTKFALIAPENRLAQISDHTFPVSDPLHWVECADDVTDHHSYDGTTFTAPPPLVEAIPSVVTNYQGRYVLLHTPGKNDTTKTLFDEIDADLRLKGVNSVEYQAWEYSNNFYRSSPLFQSISQNFNLSSDEINHMFVAAAAVPG